MTERASLRAKQSGEWRDETTGRLHERVYQHREGLTGGFTSRYGCKLLVWYESHETMESAILREKQIKAGSRKKKLALIEALNPTWRDLFEDLA
jgi:putative endonuclease